jgi:transcriptional regulator with XRE-family HTH domain
MKGHLERSTTAFDRRLGQFLRVRRLAIGMSQEALAHELGITFQQVQKYEKGVNRIAASRLFAITNALGLSIAACFDAAGAFGSRQAEADDPEAPSVEAVEILALLRRVSNAIVRGKILGLVAALVAEETHTPINQEKLAPLDGPVTPV